ncbi:MAG TPA: hypothetical protein VGS27_24925 [Candidatus Sulfotelmatobacter sp.]|nr:hypothetical protein [Candidatus Sulfotelmatobacter sp.]
MRKTFLLTLILSVTVAGMMACGGSGNSISGSKDQPSISISPMNPNILVGQTMQFTANIQNLSDTRVAWSVQEENGGTIASTDAGGLYTAPWPVGIYHVVATSVADSSLTTNTMVSVTAKFAFIEDYPGGDALPFSMTPMFGTLGTDGSIGISGVTDQGTGNPVSAAVEGLTLSSDGALAAFDMQAEDNSWDVYTANANGGSVNPTQLTTDGNSWWPQFSFDRQRIVYMNGYDIWMMNADGSNQHVVFPSTTDNWAYSATFSPDGTKVAAELEWSPGGVYHDGIALMNSDGTNAVALTGGPELAATCSSGAYDEMPAFTNDGTQIMFSRYCDGDFTETLYTINTDGTGLTRLLNATTGILHYNPIPVGEKIVFQTNQDYPGTSNFEIYSINADGSAVTRLTNNTLFDGFDNWWSSASSAAVLQQRSNRKAISQPPHSTGAIAARILNQRRHRR